MEPSSTTNTEETSSVTSVSDEKHCEHPDCGKLLVRREGERPANFRDRRHCNEQCACTNPLRLAKFRQQAEQNREQEKKNCEVCGGEFHRRHRETRKNFKQRRSCSHACAGALHRSPKVNQPKKICKVCGKEFTKRKAEAHHVFAKRENCSRECGYRGRKDTHPHERLGSGGGKRPLPPVKPVSVEIPPAPPPKAPEEIEVWRPASWGGPYKRKVS